MLSLSTAQSESYERCLGGLRDVAKRGMQVPVTITTAGASGLTKAIDAMWPKSLRIRCWFHTMRNLQQKVPAQAWSEFKTGVVDMRDAPSVDAAQARRQAIIDQYQRDLPAACRCVLDDAEASLNHLSLPPRHQHYVRTSNLAERACVAERRRTTVIPHLPTEQSLVHLVLAVLIRVSERWNKKSLRAFEQPQIRHLRERLQVDEPGVSDLELTPELRPRRSAASAA